MVRRPLRGQNFQSILRFNWSQIRNFVEDLVKSHIFIAEKEFEGFFCSYIKNWIKDKKFLGLLEKKSNSERLLNSGQLLSTIEY